jgi:serine/threonine protein kinase
LKPNNIGFIGDTVQIFDFGLSRELPALDTSIPFAMSGKVGTLRYMAPEVARHEHYNVSADVYSFAMVAYEMLALEKPYDGWTRDMHAELVCTRGLRPDTTNTCRPIPAEITLILEQAWSSNPSSRGTMSQIGVQLRFVESKEIAYVAEHRLQMELQQHQKQQQQLTIAAAATVAVANNGFFIDNMSYWLAPSPPRKPHELKHHRHPPRHSHHQNDMSNMDDSIGTIETCSLSDTSGYFY